jgi:4-alpha-glucanotransferase
MTAGAGTRDLARKYSIQLTYEDAAGKRRKASRESVEAIVKARGELRPKRDVEPVQVQWGRRTRLRPAPRALRPRITLESGEHLEQVPDELPIGYHTLHHGEEETLLMVAPLRAPAPREKTWGIFLPLYATEHANLTDLAAYREWIESLGGSVVATLPMLAAFDDEPSPYSPVSRLFWNERYLDIERLLEFNGDYSLDAMAERFVPTEGFEQFANRATEYAEFRAREGKHSARYHLYVQYRMSQQMSAMRGLYLDFPLGVNANGYDVFKYRDQFARGVSVGAPPDLFFTKGQNWGFPPLDPDAIREHRYDYFRACVRHHVEHAGILRIDHVMGLHRLFWIPDGGEAKDGVYVRYRDEELYAILLIEASRTNTIIVGEDLGTVPQYVPKTMTKRGLRRMFVVQYSGLGEPPAESVASMNTHDMPTFAGFWSGKDIDERVERGLLDEAGAADERANRAEMRVRFRTFLAARDLLHDATENTLEVLAAALANLSASDAEIVLVNLEDLWLETEPQNVPGVPEKSWRRKLRLSLEETKRDEAVMRILRTVDGERRKVDGRTK